MKTYTTVCILAQTEMPIYYHMLQHTETLSAMKAWCKTTFGVSGAERKMPWQGRFRWAQPGRKPDEGMRDWQKYNSSADLYYVFKFTDPDHANWFMLRWGAGK